LSELEQIIFSYSSIGISDMDRVKLLNRTDRKYLLEKAELIPLLKNLREEYLVLEINEKRLLRYETIYYDTPGLKLYFMHLYGFGKRFKVRKRFYRDSSTGFFELKTKTNRGKTEKKRIYSLSDQSRLSNEELDLLRSVLPFPPEELETGLFTGYNRITLVNKNINERITIDLDLYFSHHETRKDMHNLAIVEVKQDEKQMSSAVKSLRELRRKPGGLSKYCLGLIVTNPHLKFNRFKPLTLKVNKLIRAINS
jgi:hypothetical protein